MSENEEAEQFEILKKIIELLDPLDYDQKVRIFDTVEAFYGLGKDQR